MLDPDTGQRGTRARTTAGVKSIRQQGQHVEALPAGRLGSCQPTATSRLSRTGPTASLSKVDSLQQLLSKRASRSNRLKKRQQAGAGVGNVSDGYPACNNVDNDVLSCFPEDDTVLQQGQYSKFIWNTNYPVYIGAGYVDIHLFNAGSEQELFTWRNISTFRGSIGYQVDDAWLPTQSTWTDGQTLTHSYFFVIATQGADVNAGARHQATFEILQTSPPATLASQLAAAAAFSSSVSDAAATPTLTGLPLPPAVATSIVLSDPAFGSIPLTFTGDLSTITNLAGLTAVAASVSSAQSSLSSVISSLSAAGSSIPPSLLSSLSALSTSNAGIASTESSVVSSIARTRGPSVLQNDDASHGNPVPKWAIALIAVFGFLAFLAALFALWSILRRMRRKRRESQYMESKTGAGIGNDSTATSATPTVEASALGTLQEKTTRPLSDSLSDGTGNTGRMSSASAAALIGGNAASNATGRGGSAMSGDLGSATVGAAGIGTLAALGRRSDSPALKSLERSNTDRTDSPQHFYDSSPPSARFAGSTGGGVINKASSRSLGTNASTIAPYDAAIMADAYRNVLRKPEFPHRNDNSSDSGEKSTPREEEGDNSPPVLAGMSAADDQSGKDAEGEKEKISHTPKASGTTTPMAFGDSGSEEEHRNESLSSFDIGQIGLGRPCGRRESDEEDSAEANELIRHELASEGTSVRSNAERKRPDIRHD